MAKSGMGGGVEPDIFDERERAYEAKYRHDEEVAFRAEARCARLFGLAVAARLGLAGEAAEAYAKAAREADLMRPNHQELLRKVLADLVAKGVETSEMALRGEREALLEEARKQILADLAEGKQKLAPGL